MVQATGMLWNPRVGIEGAQESGVDNLRHWVEPLYTVPLFLLAIAGLFFVPSAFRALALIFVLYETAASVGVCRDDALPRALGLRARVTRGRRPRRDLAEAPCEPQRRPGRRAARCPRAGRGVSGAARARPRPRSSRA